MKAHMPILIVVFLLCIDDGITWRIRVRRTLQKVCNPVCSTVCAAKCPGCAPVCSYGCGKTVCKWLGRRRRNSDDDGFLVKLPCKFETWDTDNDGSISLSEFASAGRASVTDKNTADVFAKVDTDGDGKISEAELDSAPLLRETC